MFSRRILIAAVAVCALFAPQAATARQQQQSFIRYDRFESERSDKLTGGRIERAEFEPNEPDIRLTLNVPSFRLTLWQNGREVKSYSVGVGKKDYPIYIGEREVTEVIWNPSWIPPSSDWVRGRKGVRPGQVIKASDPRNPLGKVKIPLGDAYLIHQAAAASDLGNLVSHGCVRMLRSDLYDLAEKINAARGYPVSPKRIAAAKRSSRQLVADLGDPVPVDINYDTLVVEGGALHIYPDVYDRRTNTVARLRDELRSSGVADSALDDETLRQMIESVTRRTQFVVEVSSIEEGRALTDGRSLPLLPRPERARPNTRRRRATARR
ncbi:MAG TPA: L,D-transpeptidase [Pyrinomonadaceae bacterium]|nr:L,D-transpeptidase [Pyrinomonadaceae bacterium]